MKLTKVDDMVPEFTEAQQNRISSLEKENKFLKEKLTHMEKILTELSKNNITMDVTPEEMICIEQINLLKMKSATRDLTLEETKKLDILVRNLKLIREETTIVVGHTDVSGIKEAELVAIARTTSEDN